MRAAKVEVGATKHEDVELRKREEEKTMRRELCKCDEREIAEPSGHWRPDFASPANYDSNVVVMTLGSPEDTLCSYATHLDNRRSAWRALW